MSDGDTQDFAACETSPKIRWRVWDKICGCPGPWHEETLTCGDCGCCDGKAVGAIVSISGVANGDTSSEVCPCGEFNTSLDVPANAGACSGFAEKEITCLNHSVPPDELGRSVSVQWTILCDESGYWLFVEVNFAGTADSQNFEKFLGFEKPVCSEIDETFESVGIPGSFPCDSSSMSVRVALYSGCT